MSTNRKKITFSTDKVFKQKLLHWANNFERVCILDSNVEGRAKKQEPIEKTLNAPQYDLIVAVDCIAEIIPEKNCFESLKIFSDEKQDWLFGFFSYDLKNEIENLSSENIDRIEFPQLHFFVPKYIFIVALETVEVLYLNAHSTQREIATIIAQIQNQKIETENQQSISIKSRISKDEYIRSVEQLQKHIQQGDIYEINFCQEFYAEKASIEPPVVFENLNAISQAPFSAYYRLHDKYLMCASPERFIKKTGARIISQPIKGTRRRGKSEQEDELLKQDLITDEKERSENVMIADLVRNDLSRTAKRGSVHVEELFGVYSFKQVHQLISTIACEIKEGIHPVDVIKNAFPMGSMTGAPKVRAMQLIDAYESMKRGLFSGAVGYFTPENDFDFNVVIRSILYNNTNKYLSFCTGGAITSKANAENEYEECLLKAQAMVDVLRNKN